MLDTLKNFFKEGLEYTHTAAVLQQVGNLLQVFNGVYMKGENDKNAAIDVVCNILQSHKDQPISPIVPEVPVVTPSPEVTNATN
jgi:hypothetical protein